MASSASFGEIITRFGADTSSFSNGIDAMKRQARGFESDMSATTGKVSGGFGGMLKSALAFAGGQAIFTAVGASVGFLKDQLGSCLQESMDAQAGLALTTAVLKSTGDASGMTASAIVDLAGNLSHLTTFSDDTVQAAENMLLTFTNIGKSVFPDATKSVLDMSQALGQDTKSSAIQLGKALNDPIAGVSALQRVGVTFTQAQKDVIAKMMSTNDVAGAQGVILKEIQKEFGGAAEAAGKTFGGQMIIAQQRISDVKQTIGDALLPILTNLLTAVNAQVMPAIERFGGFVASTIIPALAQWGQMIATNLTPFLQFLGDAVGNVVTFITRLSGSLSGSKPVLLDWGGALFYAQGIMSQISSIINGTFAPALDAIKAKLGPLLSALGNVGNALGGAFAAAFRAVSIALGGVNITPLAQGLASLASQGMQIAINGLNAFAGAIRELTPVIIALSPLLSGFVTNFQLVAGVVSTFVAPALTRVGQIISANFLPILQQIGAFLVTTFKPVWDQLVTTFQTQLVPAWNDLVKAIQPVLPQLQQFGQFLLGVLGVALTLIIGIIGGLIGALAGAITGIIKIFGGIVEVISGAIKIVSGIIAFFVDIATGNFSKLGSDLGLIFDGIGTMFRGFWDIIKGVFETGTNIIVGFVTGFWTTIVGIVQNLYNDLVGHSLIPDMVNAIIGFFTTLWTKAGEIFNQIGSTIQGVWNTVSSAASTAWNTIVSTVTGLITTLWNTITQKAGQIRDTFLNAFGAVRDGIGGIVRTMANNAIGQLNNMLNGLRSFLQFFADAINNVASAVGAGNIVGTVGIGSIPYLAEGTRNFEGGPAIVGERGREMVMLPRGSSVLPHEETEQLLQTGIMGIIPGFAEGTGTPIADLVSWFTGGAGNVLNNIFSASLHFGGAMESIASSLMGMVKNWGSDKIAAMMGEYMTKIAATFSGGAASGDVAAWITSAIGLTGVPMSWLSALETIAMNESGGNPNSANTWDINAINGTPSIGLMQTIGPTFSAYAVAGHGNIYNPIDNAAAAIRYIQARYGTVFNVPGIANLAAGGAYIGYANGGVINEEILGVGASGQRYRFGESGPETVTPGNALERMAATLERMERAGGHPLDQQRIINALGSLLANNLRTNNLGVRR